MKAIERSGWSRVTILGTLFLTSLSAGFGQTQINLSTQGRNVDFTNAPYTKPIRTGSSLPAQCSAGEFFLNTAGSPGQNLFACLGASWNAIAATATASLPDPGTNGLVKRTGTNTTVAVPAPAGNVVGTSDTQTLTGKSIDASEINTGVFTAARMPAFTGDFTSSAGSTYASLASVLSSPGTFGDATHSLQVTVDGKGRVTSLTAVPLTTGLTAAFYQTLMKNGAAQIQRAATNLSNAFSLNDNAASGRTEVDLATVNSTPGTFGSSTSAPVITVNGYGQVTAVTTAPISGSGSNSNAITAGALSSIPSSCSTGALYFSSDQQPGQQLYVCSASNTWSQTLALGNSGALAFTNGALDVVNSVVPRLAAANHFTGSNQLDGTTTLSNVNITGTCSGCNSSGFANPMTALGDQIVGGTNGGATRAPIGAAGQVWTVGASGQPVWSSPSVAPSYSALSQDGNGTLNITNPINDYRLLTFHPTATNGGGMNIQYDLSAVPGGQSYVDYADGAGNIGRWLEAPVNNSFFAYSAAAGTFSTGLGFQLLSGGTQPACDSNHRGEFWFVQAAAGSEDGLQVCHQTASGFAWKVVF